MTKQECKKAETLLESRVNRTERIGADTEGGLALTAYWNDGSGQRLFYTIDEVREHLETH